ncbi:glycosyltransferase family 2 protein [Vibrio sp. SCSIO 43136]|uniref:glycosyltransferase family 2 protein n=1 Tax=Vibrio sp. SCSIO 43136 TaxID=2819101 RepID=UPI002075A952|nr:glycosyltransferase family 2 protein [Vibrio sp. SCSIO 43136]USD67039.1 glycosyltransferase family 2 protein [Vibrio sp. SCSIO 43136]
MGKVDMLSVIIPAYNEEKNIKKVLNEYLELLDDIQIIVVPNGCSDNTAKVAKNISDVIEVVSLELGNKSNAINEALRYIKYDHLLVQDADVIISENSIINILKFIDNTEYVYASLKPETKTVDSSVIVREYYKFLEKTPEFSNGMVGSGCYLLSKTAMTKCFPLPLLIGDDGYVKSILGKDRLKLVPNATSVVFAPKDTSSLVKIKTRSKLGNYQINKSIANISGDTNTPGTLINLMIKSESYISGIIYICVSCLCKFRAKMLYKTNSTHKWERDETRR